MAMQATRTSQTGAVGVKVEGEADVWVRIGEVLHAGAKGDEIVGYVTRGHGVSVHQADCTNVPNMEVEPQRFVDVSPGRRQRTPTSW